MSQKPIASSRLFLASCVALIATAMSFAVRGDIMTALGDQFALDKEQLGWISGTAFWGFTLSIVFGGPLCDVVGMRSLLRIAFLGHIGGVLLTIFAGGFSTLYVGTLLIGLANGLVEAACNPLIATVYADRKTQKLNQFHVWFPGGIVIGGVICFAFTRAMGLDAENLAANVRSTGWQLKMASILLPAIGYGLLFRGVEFPRTERAASGVSAGDMLRACARPLFVLMLLCMVMTAATELGPNQWIPDIMTAAAGVSGILVLVWINGLMALGRQFAGPVVHRLSPSGMLLGSAVFGALGLYLLSIAKSTVPVFGAATVFAIGVCYFWPTMLGFVAERVPRSGALGLALMGGAGMLSVSFVLPTMGAIYDKQILAAGGIDAPGAKAVGAAETLQQVVLVPVVLAVIFALLFLADRRRGGYRAERI